MKKFILLAVLIVSVLNAQTPDKLKIGTNISGISDWMTEMPFVDVMHQCRTWMTKNSVWVQGGQNQWDTGLIDSIPKDENGYPLHLPYFVEGAETLQTVHTIWAALSGWPEGNYTLLYDGDGDFEYFGDLSEISSEPGRIVLNFIRPTTGEGVFGLTIARSDSSNHVRNIRLLMPGTEETYQTMPYYEEWFNKLQSFKMIRFMDWGSSNNWGHNSAWECYDEDSDSIKVPWSQRAKLNDYTWATNKGVPYETMIDVCNKLHTDMWICVPYIADDDYIHQLALLIKNNLNPSLKIYVEYSNEIWNWMFGQTQWLNKFGCEKRGMLWPEGIVSYVQNCMDKFSEVFSDDMSRIVRVVGVQAAWLDVSQRIVFNMRSGSFDAFAPAAYFGLSESADSVLDSLGADATVQDIVTFVRADRVTREEKWLSDQKNGIADSLNIPMIYYEGGQHITPTPFGEEPTYAQALLDIQRDTAMYNLYTEWFRFLETLTTPVEETLFGNFSFIGSRSARYGSWGILETVTQDTNIIPAPKYSAIINYINSNMVDVKRFPVNKLITNYKLEQNYPNPFNPITSIQYAVSSMQFVSLKVYDILGNEIATLVNEEKSTGEYEVEFNGINFPSGIYFYKLQTGSFVQIRKMVLLK